MSPHARATHDVWSIEAEFSFAGGIFAIRPIDPFTILGDIDVGPQNVLPVVVEIDLADQRLVCLGRIEQVLDLGAVGANLLDRIHDQSGGGVGEGAIGVRVFAKARLGVCVEKRLTLLIFGDGSTV